MVTGQQPLDSNSMASIIFNHLGCYLIIALTRRPGFWFSSTSYKEDVLCILLNFKLNFHYIIAIYFTSSFYLFSCFVLFSCMVPSVCLCIYHGYVNVNTDPPKQLPVLQLLLSPSFHPYHFRLVLVCSPN